MTTLRDNLTNPEPWKGLVLGNEAVARAMLETGTRVITSYPGSPVPEIARALTSVPLARRRFHFEYSVNEKVALEVATGGSLNGHRAAVFFKSVGLNVASDALIQLSMLELMGGLVVVLGDDPGANSSQNEQDNRIWARMAYIPVLEPATPSEAHRMYKEASGLAERLHCPVFLRLTTHVCHAREVVHFDRLEAGEPDWTPRFDSANGPYWPIASAVFPLKRKALSKLARVEALAERSALNEVLAPNGVEPIEGKRLGVISSGLCALSVLENIHRWGPSVDLLKLGITYPLPARRVLDFLREHDEVLVIEELERVLERDVKVLALDEGVTCRIHSRPRWEQVMGEMDPVRTGGILSALWPGAFPPGEGSSVISPGEPGEGPEEVVPRPPQLCPGCGHRSAFHAVRDAIDPGTITVADIGCHSLGYLPPHNMGEILLCMGHSVSTGAGLAIGNSSRKVLAFLGDSTMFHAALPGIVNAAMYDHNVTLVLLDNGTTAMTGHQARHGSGEVGEKISTIGLLEALGVKKILDVDAYNQRKLMELIREANAHEGFAVVIARHPCMLKLTRSNRRSRPSLELPRISVDPDRSDEALPAMERFGCPTFQRLEGDLVGVAADLCIGCGSCVMTAPQGVLKLERRPEKGSPARRSPGEEPEGSKDGSEVDG